MRERHLDLLPIIITGQHDLETAIAAIRAGAFDFIVKRRARFRRGRFMLGIPIGG